MFLSGDMNINKKRLLQIQWHASCLVLPAELANFRLTQVEHSDLYEMPLYYFNSVVWREFEEVMITLQDKGACKVWRVVDLN